jgi:nitroreductase
MFQPFADADSTFRLLDPVQRAPSVFNTQPWWFRILADDRIELCAKIGTGAAYEYLDEHGLELSDGDRRLSSVDPESRELIISCGAALYNLRLSIRVAGHDLAVRLLPYDHDRSVLASVEIVTGRTRAPTYAEQELYDAIPRRHTNRWPYGEAHHWPGRDETVPGGILATMAGAAAKNSWMRVLTPPEVKLWLREAERADEKLRRTGDYATELSRWTNHGGSDTGVPQGAFGPEFAEHGHLRKHHAPVRDFRAHLAGAEDSGQRGSSGPDAGPAERKARRFERVPQLMLLTTRRDRPLDWLRAGQALQHALLVATRYGVSTSFLTQPLEMYDHDVQWRRRGRAGQNAVSASPQYPNRAPGLLVPGADDLTLLPPAQRDPVARVLPWHLRFAEYPQLVIRVGYSAHRAFITRREDPDVLDCRRDPPAWIRRDTAAAV